MMLSLRALLMSSAVAVAAVCSTSPSVVAQEPVRLTIDEAIEIALAESYDARTLLLRKRRAEQEKIAAEGRFKTNADLEFRDVGAMATVEQYRLFTKYQRSRHGGGEIGHRAIPEGKGRKIHRPVSTSPAMSRRRRTFWPSFR